MENNLPFGGKHLIIGSDFVQTLPVVEKANIAEHFDMCIKNSEFWHKLKQYKLVRNEHCQDKEWKKAFLQVQSGEKECDIDGKIELPEDIIVCDNDARILQDKQIKYFYNSIRENHNDHHDLWKVHTISS